MKDHSYTSEKTPATSVSPAISPGEVVIGYIKKVDQSGVYVDYPHNASGKHVLALATIPVEAKNVGREAALLFNGGDLNKPVIVGIIHCEMLDALENRSNTQESSEAWLDQPRVAEDEAKENSLDLVIDGKEHCIEAQEEMTLKCGKASITLTKDGKILLRGTYISSRSSGTNRILGGSILLN
jgi:hypothetical protein